MASPEMLNALLQQIGQLTAALQTQQSQGAMPSAPGLGTGGAPPGSRRLIDVKHLKVPFFDGEARKFDDWAFALKRTIRSISRPAFALLTQVENESGDIDEGLMDVDVQVDLHAYSAELYDILCQACTGEALSLVRSVDDMLGLTAWNKLYRKYNPRTMARAIRLVGAATNPPKIKDLKDAETELDKWEDIIKVLKKDFGEEFSDTVKVGIITSIMPQSIQELVYTSVGTSVKYETIVQRVRAVVSNKVAMMTGPAPMDIGWVDSRRRRMGAMQWDEEDVGFGGHVDQQIEEEDISAVSLATQCHGCGGWGHLRRECPTSKGKGKGFDKGKGKGNYDQNSTPTYGKSGFKGGKASSKGFKGACWKCGLPGHRAVDCQSKSANAVTEVDVDDQEVQLGGVWMIAAVSGTYPRVELHPSVEVQNKFIELESDDDEVEISVVTAIAVDSAPKLTRPSAIEFNVADVRKPLASAVKMVKARNRVILDEEGSYIQNKDTGECMEVRIEDETFVFDVEFENGEFGTITLDSGAGVNVWPHGKLKEVPMRPKKPGLKMCAANGTEIQNHGQKVIKFRGIDSTDFSRPA